jgi:hypothetical protein
MTHNASCSVCLFSAPGPEPGKLTCRRYPPIAFPMLVPGAPPGQVMFTASFPVVALNGWCGEYRARLDGHARVTAGPQSSLHNPPY